MSLARLMTVQFLDSSFLFLRDHMRHKRKKPSKRAKLLAHMPRGKKRVRNRCPERRRWPRLPLAIPVFVSGVERHGTKFEEFCTLLDESAGGALVAIRKSLRHGCVVSLLIPIPPMTRQLGLVHRTLKLRARVVRSAFWDLCNLYGLQFVRPLV
jgi:hypothetical protein